MDPTRSGMESAPDVLLPLSPAQPHLGPSFLVAYQRVGGIRKPHCHGERTSDQADLIITSFRQPPPPQRHRNNEFHGPVQALEKLRQLRSQSLAKAYIAAIFQAMENVSNGIFEHRPRAQDAEPWLRGAAPAASLSSPCDRHAAYLTQRLCWMLHAARTLCTPACTVPATAPTCGREQQI